MAKVITEHDLSNFVCGSSEKICKIELICNQSITVVSLNKIDAQSFATGTNDGKVQLWKIATSEHQKQRLIETIDVNKEISCITFGNQTLSNSSSSSQLQLSNSDVIESNSNTNINTNQLLAIGTVSGGIRLHNINQNKTIRQFVGHRSNIIQIDFDCLSQFVATCSSDCNVKLWDMRQKNCAITYKGHECNINCVSFSPDGRWLVSGDNNGITKLWDISQGKAIHEFHDQFSVNDAIFHPEELVLATGSSGKIVRFWDLETWEHICRTPKVTQPIKKILFPQPSIWNQQNINNINNENNNNINTIQQQQHNDDNNNDNINNDIITPSRFCIAATQDLLRIWRWEPQPVVSMYNVEIHWNDVQDMCEIPNQGEILCIESKQNTAVLWKVNLKDLHNNSHNKKTSLHKKVEKLKAIKTQVQVRPRSHDSIGEDNESVKFSELKNSSKLISKDEISISNIHHSDTNKKKPKINQLYDCDEILKMKRSIMLQHLPTLRLLSTRLRHLRMLKMLWKNNKQKEFLYKLQQLQKNDDICKIVIKQILNEIKSKIFSIQFCTGILSIVQINMLESTDNNNDIMMALNFIQYMIESFSNIIIDMKNIDLQSFKHSSITLEDRKNNCQQCNEKLIALKPTLCTLAKSDNIEVSSKSEKCLQLLETLQS